MLITIARGIDALNEWVGRAASWLTLALVLLIAANVLLRYGFSIGSVAGQELEWHLLAVLTMLGLAYTLLHGEHVRVDIFYQHYSERTKHRLEVVTAFLITLPASLYVAYLSIAFVEQAFLFNEISPDPGGLTHRWILKLFLPIGFVLLGLQGLSGGLKSIDWLRRERAGLIATPDLAAPLNEPAQAGQEQGKHHGD